MIHRMPGPSRWCVISRCRKRWLSTLLLCLLHFAQPATARQPGAKLADAQAAAQFREQLAQTIGVTWQDHELLAALDTLAETWQVPIFLDRRVDPQTLLTFQSRERTLEQTLREMARQLQLEVALVQSVVYIGPAGVSDVAAVAEVQLDRARQRSDPLGRRLLQRQPLAWDELTEPRQLLVDTLQTAGLKLVNGERIPHDLWRAGSLPPMPLTHQLVILLAGFDLTYEFGGDPDTLHLIDMPRDVKLARDYPLPAGANRSAAQIAALQQQLPGATLRVNGRTLHVVGSADDHDQIRRALQNPRNPPPGHNGGRPAEIRFTLKATAPAQAILATIAQRAELTLVIDPSVQSQASRPVTLQVKDATLGELLEQLTKSAGLTYALDPRQQQLRIGKGDEGRGARDDE